jgi:hypothetical protein
MNFFHYCRQKAREANEKREMLAEAALLKKTGEKLFF